MPLPYGAHELQIFVFSSLEKSTIFTFRILFTVIGVLVLMMMASLVSGFEVEEGRRDLIGLGEGVEGSLSPLLNPTLTLFHLTHGFMFPLFSANSHREKKEEEDYGEEREREKRGG